MAHEAERTKFKRHSVARVLGESESTGAHLPRPVFSRPTCRWLCSTGGVADRSRMAVAVAEPRLDTSGLKVQSMLRTFTAYLLRMVVDRNAMRTRLGGIQLDSKAIWKMDATRDR